MEFYSNRDKYEGEFKNNKREGYGINIILKEEGMKDNSKIIGKKVLEYYMILIRELIKENRKILHLTDMEYFIMIMGIDMKVNLKVGNLKDLV